MPAAINRVRARSVAQRTHVAQEDLPTCGRRRARLVERSGGHAVADRLKERMRGDRLLCDDDPPVYALERPGGSSPVLLVCDHAGRAIPRMLGDLGVSQQELATHVAWDLGIAGLGRRLSARLDAFLIQHCYSRLVIDVNRPPGSAESIVTLSERTRVPGNAGLSPAQVQQRREELFEPYHRRIREELERRVRDPRASVLVALHSFTPRYMDVARRWHAGVLYGRDPRLGRALLEELRSDASLVVGDNEPYAVSDETDFTIVAHGERRGIPHVELEIRQDLLADDEGQERWSERLAAALERSMLRLFPT
jgi:predicted N-formylglutamate amidohydrolase